MTKKMKLVITALVGSLFVGGVAIAQPGSGPSPDRKAKWAEKKQEKLAKFDTNRDGKLDDAERAVMRDVMLTERFKQLDTDGNGVISLAEFKAGNHKMGKRHGRMGKGHKRSK
jgi:hypothetical protein